MGIQPVSSMKLNPSEYYKQYYEKNKARINEKRRKVYSREKTRLSAIKTRYGLSIAAYNSMLEKQNFVCAICKQKEKDKGKFGAIRDLSVDHCHSTGKVRGLLCNSCNRGLGFFKDNLELISTVLDYLNKSR